MLPGKKHCPFALSFSYTAESSQMLVYSALSLVPPPYHVVCERGTQDGISRALGNKVLDFKDFDNIPMPAHKYDDDGIRRDGINPLTHNGYNEEEMNDQ